MREPDSSRADEIVKCCRLILKGFEKEGYESYRHWPGASARLQKTEGVPTEGSIRQVG